jgi:predicted transposase YbfD/YdcC
MRRSFDHATGGSPPHVVTAFAADTRMAIGQVAASDKESEIIAARTLPDLIDLKGPLVTGDALNCQSKTARLINDRGGNWLFTPKANRPVQHAEVSDWFADPVSRQDEEHTTTDADTGRIEVSHHAVCHDVNWMSADRRHPDQAARPSLAMLGMVEASVSRDGKTTTARRFYLSSVAMGAARLPPPCARTGALKTARTRFGTWGSIWIGHETDVTMARKTSRSHENTLSMFSARHAQSLDQTQAEAIRLVRRIRTLRTRSNAIALTGRWAALFPASGEWHISPPWRNRVDHVRLFSPVGAFP